MNFVHIKLLRWTSQQLLRVHLSQRRHLNCKSSRIAKSTLRRKVTIMLIGKFMCSKWLPSIDNATCPDLLLFLRLSTLDWEKGARLENEPEGFGERWTCVESSERGNLGKRLWSPNLCRQTFILYTMAS